jgi:hypothetical protein
MPPTLYCKRVDLMVQPHEWQMLLAVSHELHCKPSAAIRHFIYSAHQHMIQNLHRCADGTHCARALATETLNTAIANITPPPKRK